MSLASEVAALRVSRTRCSIARVSDALDEPDRGDLARLLDDPEVLGTLISRALIARGHNVKPHTVQRHRRGICECHSGPA